MSKEVDFGGMVGDFLAAPPPKAPDVQVPGNTPPLKEVQPPSPRVQQAVSEVKVTPIKASDMQARAEQLLSQSLSGQGAAAPGEGGERETPTEGGTPGEKVDTPPVEEDNMVPDDVLPASAAEEVTPPPPPPPEDQEPPEITANPKARNAWTKSKQEQKRLKAELETVRAELEAAKKNPPTDPAELEKLKQAAQERDRLIEELGKRDVTLSPEFKKQYDLPINQKYQQTLAALVQAGKKPEDAKSLILKIIKPGNDANTIQDMIIEEAPLLQGILFQNGLEMIELQKRRAGAVQDWKATKSALREEEQRSAQALMQSQMESAVSTAVDALRTEGSWAFKQSASNQKWNAEVDQRIEAVKGILKTASPEVLAKYVADGVAAKAYREHGAAVLAQNKKLRAELAQLVGARPGLGGRRTDVPPAPRTQERGPLKPEDYLERALG